MSWGGGGRRKYGNEIHGNVRGEVQVNFLALFLLPGNAIFLC